MGNWVEADRLLQTALPIAVELGDKLTQSLVMGGIADIYIDRTEYQRAIQTLNQAIEILKESYDVRAELRLLQSLGNAYTASDDYPNALGTYSHLSALAESIGAKAVISATLANQTSIYQHSGNLELALETGEKGLHLAKEINSLSDEAFIHWQLGLVHEARGYKDNATIEMKMAIEIESKIDSLQLEKHREYFNKFILNQ
jgi:tetratricopeptide (TPR) repeat protein